MSYLFIVIIGAVAGWVGGQFLKGSEIGVILDLAAGAIGAFVAVLLSRLLGPAAATGLVMSAIVAVAGAIGTLYGMRQFMKEKPLPVSRARRRP